jgi:hypothetical protein
MVFKGIKAISRKASIIWVLIFMAGAPPPHIVAATPRRQLAWLATLTVNRSPKNSFIVLPPFRLVLAHDEVASKTDGNCPINPLKLKAPVTAESPPKLTAVFFIAVMCL